MYCKNCGNEIADDSSFCRYCGIDLTESDSIASESTDNNIDTFSEIISDTVPSNKEVSIDECSNADSLQKEVDNSISSNDSSQDSKIMKVLGTLSGILLLGVFAVLGLGLMIGALFIIYWVIMLNFPNGKGITLFCIILLVTVYFAVKLVVNIVKSLRK